MNIRIDLRARPTHHDRWVWGVVFSFVFITLIALAFVPVLVQRRVDAHRAKIQSSETARTLVMELQFNLVRERSALSYYARSGDTAYASAFNIARAAERRDLNALAPLARSLGPDVFAQFMVARSITERWHHEIGADQLAERGAAAVQIGETPAMQRFFVNMLRETGKLDSTIVATTESVRSQIGGAERTGLILSFVLGMLAILAAAGVGALVYRMRKLAEETERRRMETAAALAESARAAEARTRLLRGITHDVKNPLGAAKGYADLLELGIKGSLSEEQHKLVKGMARSIDNALAIISDLLDLARSDSGGITVQRVRTDLNQLACEAVEDHRAAGQSAGHVLECRNTEGELIAFTDPLRVRQVLDNLISNAIKYTPAPGRIVVRPDPASRAGPRAGRYVAIFVSDTGPGIPAEKREMIFDEFTRLDDGGAMKGHGLGLAIARRVARMLGGDLTVADTKSPGATLALYLPQREDKKLAAR